MDGYTFYLCGKIPRIMNILKFVKLVLLVGFIVNGAVHVSAVNGKVSSPDGTVTVTVGVKNKQPFYMVNYGGKMLVAPSHLGYQLNDGALGANTRMGRWHVLQMTRRGVCLGVRVRLHATTITS